MKMAFLFYF